MPTIKVRKIDEKKFNYLREQELIAMMGVRTAQKIHYEAHGSLWDAILKLYPKLVGYKSAEYKHKEGIITFIKREKEPDNAKAEKGKVA